MKMKMRTKWKSDFCAIASIGFFYGFLFLVGITCPIKFLVGISCPGCGMTRAWISAIRFQFSDAFHYHPLFWIIPILLLVLLSKGKKVKINSLIMGIAVLLFVVIYIYRMIIGNSDIVIFDPANGFIFKCLKSCILGG